MTKVTLSLDDGTTVSGQLDVPAAPRAIFVFAHGAGAGMAHPFMTAFASNLAALAIATLRYQFPYMERGSKRPDTPKVAHAAVRAAVARAQVELPDAPIFAGGKSFGGRMTSQAQADAALPGVSGLVFVGFPLHPAGKPATDRADHLARVHVPMLFLSGTRDELAQLHLLEPVVRSLGARATLSLYDEADHSFHVPAKSGRNDAQVRQQMADDTANWIAGIAGRKAS